MALMHVPSGHESLTPLTSVRYNRRRGSAPPHVPQDAAGVQQMGAQRTTARGPGS
jgi:hypothetical protein